MIRNLFRDLLGSPLDPTERLIAAAMLGDTARVSALLSSGEETTAVNAQQEGSGATALLRATAMGRVRMVELLIERGMLVRLNDV